METNTQQLIIIILGISLVLSIIMRYPSEIITTIIAGLIGFLSTKTLTDKQSQAINNNLNTLTQETEELETLTNEEAEEKQ